MKTYKLFLIFVALVFTGCSSSFIAMGAGERYDPVPPKIKIGKDNVKTWDRPGAFGPVPSALQATGNKTCGYNMKAVGYHPEAQDENGNTLPKGGFLCISYW